MPRPQRRASAAAAAAAVTASPVSRRSSRKVKEEPTLENDSMDVDAEANGAHEEDHEEEEEPQPGPSRRRSKGRASVASNRRGRASKIEDDATDVDDDPPSAPSSSRRRSAKQVSYKEIPIEDKDDEEDDADENDDEDEEEAEPVSTPAPRNRRAATRPKKKEPEDKPYKKEPGTGGRGGFSVKGAAAAAARARWDKVRRERAERGEDSPSEEKRRKQPKDVVTKRDPRGALENVIEGHRYSVKNVEYVAGDDELIIPEDEKGNTKVDSEGRLLGGREYKLVTFTSPTRKNPERVYALTIDAARACGYTDSLAFLRRCPTIVKLSCGEDERQMLIDIGRITGNLKHRMVTMVAMRNVYKLMGARVVKDGKWVTDDYNEEQGLVDCAANGWTPYTPVLEEELAVNQYPSAGGPGRPPANAGLLSDGGPLKSNLSSFYQVGGPTTHFGGNGMDPWNDVIHGKRGRLRALGVTEEDWILRTAEDARRIDEVLRGYREERIGVLEGADTRCWVYNAERRATGELPPDDVAPAPPVPAAASPAMPKTEGDVSATVTPAIKPHPLASELHFDASSEPLSPLPPDPPTASALEEVNETAEFEKNVGGKIVVETEADTEAPPPLGGWIPGTILAAYEPHTQMPHVPLRTQSTNAEFNRMAYKPLLGMNGNAHLVSAQGIASVEFVFDPSKDTDSWLAFGDGTRGRDVAKARREAIAEAEEWERTARAKRRKLRDEARATAATADARPVTVNTPVA